MAGKTRLTDFPAFSTYVMALPREICVSCRMRYRLAILFAGLLALSVAVAGSPAVAKKRARAPEPGLAQRHPPRALVPEAMRLQPGQYTWYAERATSGPVEVVMSLSQQRAYVFQSGSLLGIATISSGSKGRESPYGRFQILEKKLMHRSIRYDNAPMPHMMRLNWYGVAMHGGHVPGYPASHGCIRLPPAFAQKLYGVATVGSFVYVTHDSPYSPQDALELARANYAAPTKPDRLPRGGQEEAYAEAFPDRAMPAAYAEQTVVQAPPPRPQRPAKPRRSLWDRIF